MLLGNLDRLEVELLPDVGSGLTDDEDEDEEDMISGLTGVR
jgi:hypothetical protein